MLKTRATPATFAAMPKLASATVKVLGQPSWKIATPRVEAYVTHLGGHLGPVTFDRRQRKIQPFSIAPWAKEKIDPAAPPVLKALRGDFFCLPFGGNETAFQREKHPPHGETANAKWKFESIDEIDLGVRLHVSLRTKTRAGVVDKYITLPRNHDAVYQRHVISSMTGPMSLGHHAMLKFPDEKLAGAISTSRFEYGQVLPMPFEQPENRGYSMLKPGAEFQSLRNVPTITGEAADLTRYPARRGFDDLVMLVNDLNVGFAWTAVTFPRERYVWFALKDPHVLRNTILWISNGGRYYAPWNGRHVNVMGVEETTSYFHIGLAESARRNALTARGVPTAVMLHDDRPLTVNYIIAVASIPTGFDRVATIKRDNGGVTLQSESGRRVHTVLDVDFLKEE